VLGVVVNDVETGSMSGFTSHGSYGYGYRKYGYGAYGGYGHMVRDDPEASAHKSAEAASTVTDEE
jgi:hypothetical protein